MIADQKRSVCATLRQITTTFLGVQLQTMILYVRQIVNNPNKIIRLTKAILIVLFIISAGTSFYYKYAKENSLAPQTAPAGEVATSTEEILSAFPMVATSSAEVLIEDAVSKNTKPASMPDTPVFIAPAPSPSPAIEVGVFAGTIPELYTFEHRIGEQVDVAATAVHWGNERDFPEAYANLVTGRGTTLLIYWYPMDYTKSKGAQDEFHFKKILDGAWDEYIDSFAQAAAKNGGDIIIAPFEEVNGSWTYWNGVNGTYGTKEEYIDTFHYLRNKMRIAPNVRFAWIVNHVSVPDTNENAITAYYPGDTYVDIIGINAFNFGTPWLSFDALIGRAVGGVLPYHKPIYITSTASAPGEQKATWIQDMFASTYFKNGTVKGFVWFNENKERDWSVWSDGDSEQVFRDAL